MLCVLIHYQLTVHMHITLSNVSGQHPLILIQYIARIVLNEVLTGTDHIFSKQISGYNEALWQGLIRSPPAPAMGTFKPSYVMPCKVRTCRQYPDVYYI